MTRVPLLYGYIIYNFIVSLYGKYDFKVPTIQLYTKHVNGLNVTRLRYRLKLWELIKKNPNKINQTLTLMHNRHLELLSQ